MRIIFIRHAEPDYAVDGLTPKGVREADLLAPRVAKWNVRQFYCSPLGRAKMTAEHAMRLINRDTITYDWMREFFYLVTDLETGTKRIPWDFLPDKWADDPKLWDKDHWFESPRINSPEVKEKYDELCRELDRLLASYGYVRHGNYYKVESHTDDTIVVFCHLGVTFAMLSHLLNVSPVTLWQGFSIAPSSVTVAATEERDGENAYFRCHLMGDVTHLHDAGEPASASGYFGDIFQL